MDIPTIASGLAWHVHHDILVEWCHNYQERVDDIKQHKPLSEQDTRLRLFQMVKGPSPAKVDAAWAKVDAAKVDDAWAKLYAAILAHLPQFLALHAIECPNCPWDGQTIFPAS